MSSFQTKYFSVNFKRVLLVLQKQFSTFHSNRVKCEKQIIKQNVVFTFYSIRVECEELFVKLIKQLLKLTIHIYTKYVLRILNLCNY